MSLPQRVSGQRILGLGLPLALELEMSEKSVLAAKRIHGVRLRDGTGGKALYMQAQIPRPLDPGSNPQHHMWGLKHHPGSLLSRIRRNP